MAASVRSEPGPKFDRATLRVSGVPADDSGNRASGSLGNEYCYSPLPHGSIRLLRLMPHKDKEAPIRCQLFEYSLQEPGQGIHLYEALSYAWGSQKNKQPIHVQSNDKSGGSSATPSTGNDHCLLVTANLREAFTRVRNRLFERVLWIDAVCINQGDDGEKGRQVQFMAKIYANASRVIVWLGEAIDGGDQALEAIRMAAQEQYMGSTIYRPGRQATCAQESANSSGDETNQQAILKLLERPWFQRIWVLQEVAAARGIVVKCGSVEIDGYAFCLGMDALKPYQSSPELSSLIRSVAYLIRGAGFRPRSENGPAGSWRFSLGIRPLSELVDMYHGHKATERRDKVYALLGMSLDDLSAAGLSANYKIPWKDVFRKLIRFCLSDQVLVSTWDAAEVAVVEAKGYVLGEVTSIREDDLPQNDRQAMDVTWKCAPGYYDTEGKGSSSFTFQASAKTIKKGDVVCLLQGASTPTIVRLCDGFSTVVMITLPRTNDLPEWLASIARFPTDFLLVWDWDESRKSQGGEDYGDFISSRGVPKCSKAGCECQDRLDEAARWLNLGVLLNGIERYEEAVQHFRKAVEAYSIGAALRSEGNTGHVCWRKEDEKALRVLDELLIDGRSAAIEEGYKEHGHTPLWWAAEEGCEAFAWLLIKNGADIEAVDHYGCAPLHCAAKKGHEAVARLLVEQGADIEVADPHGWTPLYSAIWKGHEAVARLLVELNANIKAKNDDGWTPLHFVAWKGHEAAARLLVELGADIEAKNNNGWTPLNFAAWKGHEAVARLLVELGADIEAKNNNGWTPLNFAAWKGHEAAAKLLVELGADIEAKNNNGWTPLHSAAWNGYEAVARLLVELGADIEAKSNNGWTPLHSAAWKGHEAVARLLVELGADIEAKNRDGRTPLHLAEDNGYEAVAKLFIL
ncbi:hypothetical protein RB595_005742 [Gaeumannomyces hyphopodioides]